MSGHLGRCAIRPNVVQRIGVLIFGLTATAGQRPDAVSLDILTPDVRPPPTGYVDVAITLLAEPSSGTEKARAASHDVRMIWGRSYVIGRYEKPVSLVAVLLASALALAGCGESGQASAPDRSPGAQQSAKPTVHELYREFLVGLNDRDAKRVCPLFTPDGQATFAKEWEATTCEGAVDRAAARFGDMSNVIAKADEKKIEEKNGIAKFGSDSCIPGRLSARKDDAGWLLFDYSFAGGGCMG